MAQVTYSVESAMFVDARIRAPWVLVARRASDGQVTRVVSHHESFADGEEARSELEHEEATDRSIAEHERGVVSEARVESIEIGSGILADVAAKGCHVILVLDGEPYAFPASTARRLARALDAAAESAR